MFKTFLEHIFRIYDLNIFLPSKQRPRQLIVEARLAVVFIIHPVSLLSVNSDAARNLKEAWSAIVNSREKLMDAVDLFAEYTFIDLEASGSGLQEQLDHFYPLARDKICEIIILRALARGPSEDITTNEPNEKHTLG